MCMCVLGCLQRYVHTYVRTCVGPIRMYIRTFLLSVVTSIALGMNNAVFCFARHKISSNRMATCEERKADDNHVAIAFASNA